MAYTAKTPIKRTLLGVLRKNVLILFCLVVLTGMTIYYINTREEYYVEPVIMHFLPANNNISCHYTREGDALPAAEEGSFAPHPNSIFFHETSCSGGLNSRQACAVESAARAHPRRQIYVLFSAPVSYHVLTRSSLAKLRNFPNVKLARVHINEYAKNTPLEEMIARDPFNESQWRVEHTSDVLRYLTLYKFGGVYLDTDMLVVKPLTGLGHNWVAKEDETLVNAAAIAVSMDHLGRKVAEDIINEVKTTYRPDLWMHNGPGAITRVLQRMCHPASMEEWSADTCNGLEVYSREYFYPVHYSSKDRYFKPGDLQDVDGAYTHHLWSKLTYKLTVEKDSPYEKMAKEYCPTIYEMYGNLFGT